jgi:predicted short-subunit dehydrogenase-like oxidoreductase (DUF2520 family)
VAVIGAGRVGTALGVLLERAGHRVTAASGWERSRDRVRRYLPFTRFLPAQGAHSAAGAARVVILAVPDDAVGSVCSDLAARGAFGVRQRVLHLSGSVGLDALAPAEQMGAGVLSVHPLQTVPGVEEGIRRLPGSGFAVTARDEPGFAFGESLVADVGGRPFRLPDDMKPLYHAAAVFCANYLVTVEGLAERLFRLAGLERPLPVFAPLARAALDAALEKGPAAALTGPVVRGDTGTIDRNLEALARHSPDVIRPYVELASAAAELAVEGGRLSEEDRARIEEALRRWR